jgi:hypothetical protein
MPPFTVSPRRHRGAVRTGLAAAVLAAALAAAAAPAPAQDPRPQPLWNTYPLREGTPGGQAAGASPRASLGASPAVRNAVERAPGPGDATGAVVLLASLMALTALLTVALRARRRPPTPSAPLSVPLDEDPPPAPRLPVRRAAPPPPRPRPPRAVRSTERPDRGSPRRQGHTPSRGRRK